MMLEDGFMRTLEGGQWERWNRIRNATSDVIGLVMIGSCSQW